MRPPMAKQESVLKATYEILKYRRYSGVATFIFRTKLMERLHEYNDDIIRDLEEILIQYEWILRDKKTMLLIPTKKLLYAPEFKLLNLSKRTAIPISNKLRYSQFLRI
ncbi:hypothetical protein [Methanobacterium sp.]|uniref:hypothetical protein n=1 Tax=Methanobacterium sp. TaxID=2164 RepID=UPI003C7315D9